MCDAVAYVATARECHLSWATYDDQVASDYPPSPVTTTSAHAPSTLPTSFVLRTR